MKKNNWKKYACLSALVIATTTLQTTNVEATKQISNKNIQIKCGCEHRQNVQKQQTQAVEIKHEHKNQHGSNMDSDKVLKPQHETRVKTNVATPATPQSVTPMRDKHPVSAWKKTDKNLLPISFVGELIHTDVYHNDAFDGLVSGITFDIKDVETGEVYVRNVTTTNGIGYVIPRDQNAHIPNGAFLTYTNVRVPSGYKLVFEGFAGDQYSKGVTGWHKDVLNVSNWPEKLKNQIKLPSHGGFIQIRVTKLPAKVAAATAQLPKHNQNSKAVQTPQKPAQTKPSVVTKSVNKVPVVANKIQSTPKQNLQSPTQKTTSYVRGTNKENSNVMLEMGVGASMVLGGLVLRNKLKK